MKLTFLGCGDAFGSGGQFNTCFMAEPTDADAFLIDFGASSVIAMRRFNVDPNRIRTIFISHLHGDHFGGLPFLLLDAQFYSRRTGPVTLVGPPGFRDRLTQAMELFFHGSSTAKRKLETEVIEIEPGKSHHINGVSVTPYLVNHVCGAPPFALRLECAGKVIAYSGDTEWAECLVDAGCNADVFIAEALTFERPTKFHLDYASLKANLKRIGAKRVILTHMGPDMLARVNDVAEQAAHDGLVVEL